MTKMLKELKKDLDQRGESYGRFAEQAHISVSLKNIVDLAFNDSWTFAQLPSRKQHVVQEGLSMILHKISRLANGDPTHYDSWKDIAGYAAIVVRDLEALTEEEVHEQL